MQKKRCQIMERGSGWNLVKLVAGLSMENSARCLSRDEKSTGLNSWMRNTNLKRKGEKIMTEIFNMLVQTLKDNLSEEFTVTSAIVRKNNNTKHYSISIRKDEEPTVPTLYVDDILEDIGDSMKN